jgi:hypothetical protein
VHLVVALLTSAMLLGPGLLARWRWRERSQVT